MPLLIPYFMPLIDPLIYASIDPSGESDNEESRGGFEERDLEMKKVK